MRWIALLVAAILAPVAVHGGECTARSGPRTTTLVELYTSEGCDSCPPADQWLSTLPGTFDGARIAPLAFHVDYWDYIGWKDPFAQAAWTARQREGVRISGARVAYTPQVALNGKDFRSWSSSSAFREALSAANARASRADIALAVIVSQRVASVNLDAHLLEAAGGRDAALYLAVTESRLVSAVKAGENKGATLRHDHVVRELRAIDRFASSPRILAKQSIALAPGWKPEHVGFTAFVQDTRTGEILQAIALPPCPA